MVFVSDYIRVCLGFRLGNARLPATGKTYQKNGNNYLIEYTNRKLKIDHKS
jgi:hypothetical protein